MPRSKVMTALPVEVDLPITLGQFIKVAGLAVTGGEAKRMIVSGLVRVNSSVEMHRGRRLEAGDTVQLEGADPRLVAVRGVGNPRQSAGRATPPIPGD